MSTALARFTAWCTNPAHRTQTQVIALAAITLVAFVLRFYKLGEWSFWIDEIYTINRARAHYSNIERTLHNIPPHTNWVPVSLLFIAAVIGKLGVSEWSVRLVPALIGALSVPALYLPIKRMFGTAVALVTTLLLAVSPWHIYWSQNGRFYVALMLLYTLTLFAIYFGLEKKRPAYLLLALFLFYFAMSERMLAGFAIPVIAVYLLLLWLLRFPYPAGLNRQSLGILSLPVIGGILVEAYSLVADGYSRFFGDSDAFIGNAVDSPLRIFILIVFGIGLPIVILSLFTGGWVVHQRNRAGLFMLVSAAVPVVLLLGISPWVFVVERYALITLPAWLILTSLAIQQLARWLPRQGLWLAVAVMALLLVDAAASHLMYFELNNGNRPDWRGAFAYVAANRAPDDLIVSTRPEIGMAYLGSDSEILNLVDLDPAELAAGETAVWFVIDSEAVWYTSEATRTWMTENARLLFVWYLRVREQIDMKVYYYQPAHAPIN